MSIRLYQARSSSLESMPVNSASGARGRNASRPGPSPIITSCACPLSGSKARKRVGMFFSPASLPTNATIGFSVGLVFCESGSTRSSSGRTLRSSEMMGMKSPFPKWFWYQPATSGLCRIISSSRRGTKCRASRCFHPKSLPWIMSRLSSQKDTTLKPNRFRRDIARKAARENSGTKTKEGRYLSIKDCISLKAHRCMGMSLASLPGTWKQISQSSSRNKALHKSAL